MFPIKPKEGEEEEEEEEEKEEKSDIPIDRNLDEDKLIYKIYYYTYIGKLSRGKKERKREKKEKEKRKL